MAREIRVFTAHLTQVLSDLGHRSAQLAINHATLDPSLQPRGVILKAVIAVVVKAGLFAL